MRAQQSAGRGIAKLAAEATRGYRRDDGYRGEKPGYATTPKFPITFRGTRTDRRVLAWRTAYAEYGLGDWERVLPGPCRRAVPPVPGDHATPRRLGHALRPAGHQWAGLILPAGRRALRLTRGAWPR